MPTTLRDAIVYFADKDRAHAFLTQFRWPDGKPACPRCESTENSFLSTRNLWKCKGCKKQFSAKAGTVMEDSPIGLDKWLPAIWMICGCKNGISSYELSRDLGVSQKTAWFMLHRIREVMKVNTGHKLSGEVEADETFIGGAVRNMHRRSKRTLDAKNNGLWGKTVVLGLLERDGHVRAAVAPNRKKRNIEPHLKNNVEAGSKLYTDEHPVYNMFREEYAHEMVNHIQEYVRGRVHTNGLENFWSLLKRTLKGTYVSVDPAHLQSYVDEQAFRFNNREFEDAERFVCVLSQLAGKRLTFDELTGRQMESSMS